MDWNLTPEEAIKLQETLASELTLPTKIECRNRPFPIISGPKDFEIICGVDAAFDDHKAYAVCCSFLLPDLELVEETAEITDINYPYIPGLFVFREGPALLGAIKKLQKEPDVILFDGQGIAHPRRFGMASHLGYLLNKPTIGCAKTKLIGEYDNPKTKKGAWNPLIFNKDTVGAVVRTKTNVKPVFISPGNLINLESSIKIVLSTCRGYRIPEPLRRANIKSKQLAGKTGRNNINETTGKLG